MGGSTNWDVAAVVKTLKDAATEFKRFLEDHIPHVKDRRAFEQKLTKVKPDGEKGAFGEEFEKVADDFGYIMDPSLPRIAKTTMGKYSRDCG